MTDKPTLVIDTREKRPWSFDDDASFDEVVYEKLDAGDYAIKGMEEVCVIERKANGDELLNNFTQNKKRIYAEIDRLKNYKCKYIVIEQDLADLMSVNNYYINTSGRNKRNRKMPIAVVISNLVDIMVKHGVHVIFAGSKAQAISRGILLRAYELHNKGEFE